VHKVCLEHLKPGMELGKDVPGADGSVFMQAGHSLDQDSIAALAELGLASVLIRGDKPAGDKLLNMVGEYVYRFFMYVDPDSEAFQEMFRVSVMRTHAAVEKGWDLPCRAEFTAQSVEHMSDLFLKGQGQPQDIVDRETELASFPDTYFRIKDVLESPTSSAKDVAEVVNADVGLSAKVLKLVNSPFYGLAATVDSVERAVSLIGLKELSTLALGVSAVHFFKDIPPELIDMKIFWRHSLSCAIFAKLIASKVSGLQPERMFTAGLLHDAGKLVMFKNMPYASVEALLYARHNLVPYVEAEKQTFGYDHAEIGKLLLTRWKFPAAITDAIAHHHQPDQAQNPREAAVIQAADNLTNAAEISSGGMFILPGMEDEVWQLVGLDQKDIEELMQRHDKNIDEVTRAFL